jgi:AcrR family transcriptional regulator
MLSLLSVNVVPPPQQLRSRRTRARIVEAAARCIVEHGYAGSSTAVVAQAAGVSQGALFKHFPTKALLLAASVASILADMVERFREDATRRLLQAAPRTVEERIAPAIAALWAIFRAPDMKAVFEVYVAARTDRALAAELSPLLDRHRARVVVEARALFPEHAEHAEFDGVIDAVVHAMQGVALGLFAPDSEREAKNLALFERLARRELEHIAPGDRPKTTKKEKKG